MLKKELSSNSYRLTAFFGTMTTTILVPPLVQSFIFLIIIFSMSGVSQRIECFLAIYGVICLG